MRYCKKQISREHGTSNILATCPTRLNACFLAFIIRCRRLGGNETEDDISTPLHQPKAERTRTRDTNGPRLCACSGPRKQ